MKLQREGAEVVITVEDDGAGLNVAADSRQGTADGIAAARHGVDRRGVAAARSSSLASARRIRLTQQAGRGVGMDVVATEVKKLGGALFIESKPGAGARFTIRLPFTLAITQALIVRVHDELFALPMATVEGIVAADPHRDPASPRRGARLVRRTAAIRYRFQHLGVRSSAAGRRSCPRPTSRCPSSWCGPASIRPRWSPMN